VKDLVYRSQGSISQADDVKPDSFISIAVLVTDGLILLSMNL